MARINPFSMKRIAAFESLKTKPTDWVHAKVINYHLNVRKIKKSEKMMEEWIPEYSIPEGYENPLEKDVLSSDEKKCQLCDTAIYHYGILINESKKMWILVGLECYVVYETDDDREMKLRLLKQLKDGYIQDKIRTQKEILQAALKEKVLDPKVRPFENDGYYFRDAWYKAYSVIKRDFWYGFRV